MPRIGFQSFVLKGHCKNFFQKKKFWGIFYNFQLTKIEKDSLRSGWSFVAVDWQSLDVVGDVDIDDVNVLKPLEVDVDGDWHSDDVGIDDVEGVDASTPTPTPTASAFNEADTSSLGSSRKIKLEQSSKSAWK